LEIIGSQKYGQLSVSAVRCIMIKTRRLLSVLKQIALKMSAVERVPIHYTIRS